MSPKMTAFIGFFGCLGFLGLPSPFPMAYRSPRR